MSKQKEIKGFRVSVYFYTSELPKEVSLGKVRPCWETGIAYMNKEDGGSGEKSGVHFHNEEEILPAIKKVLKNEKIMRLVK